MAGDHAAQEKDVWIPAQRHGIAPEHEATMVLPVYATLTPAAERALGLLRHRVSGKEPETGERQPPPGLLTSPEPPRTPRA